MEWDTLKVVEAEHWTRSVREPLGGTDLGVLRCIKSRNWDQRWKSNK